MRLGLGYRNIRVEIPSLLNFMMCNFTQGELKSQILIEIYVDSYRILAFH
jgi:hypothetical protein